MVTYSLFTKHASTIRIHDVQHNRRLLEFNVFGRGIGGVRMCNKITRSPAPTSLGADRSDLQLLYVTILASHNRKYAQHTWKFEMEMLVMLSIALFTNFRSEHSVRTLMLKETVTYYWG
jgi:hypothetical protein